MSNKIEKLFENAVRTKMRFQYRGLISVEDLWDLKLSELDSIFKVLNSQVKQQKEESLLETKTEEDAILDNQIAIIKHIVNVKQNEALSRFMSEKNKEQKDKILAILAHKQNSELKEKSVDELQAMLKALD